MLTLFPSSQANELKQEEAVNEFRSKGQADLKQPKSLLFYPQMVMSDGYIYLQNHFSEETLKISEANLRFDCF